MNSRMTIVLLLILFSSSSCITSECLAQPRIVIGLRHNVNQANQIFKPNNVAGLTRYFVRDAGTQPDMGYSPDQHSILQL